MLREFTLPTGQNNWTDITSRAREALRESGYDLDYLERRLKKRLAFVRKHLSPKVHLAATTAVEHLTAIMADAILQNPDWLEGPDPTMARLWRSRELSP